MDAHDLPTPALVVDLDAFDRNVATMAARWPGTRLRPHVKAFKSTALAARLAAAGHTGFCCATVREVEGMAAAGLATDLLLANEVVGPAAERLGAVARGGAARVTTCVDSPETVEAAAKAGVAEVLVDVDVGTPRCGCQPTDAGRIADHARSLGLEVRGVQAYEGALMREPAATKDAAVEAAGALARAALADAGGDVLSGGGTGTWATNTWATELQAGSYCLMDTEYVAHAPAFELALSIHATVISVGRGWAVADAGLKAMAMDHGDPTIEGTDVWFVSDEHTTFGSRTHRVGDRVRVLPAHVDPTVAYHEVLHVVSEGEVVERWPVDLRGW